LCGKSRFTNCLPQLKGLCHHKAHVHSWLTPISLTKRNRNTNTCEPWICPRWAWSFTCFLKISLSVGFWRNIYHVYVVWRLCPLNTSTYALVSFNLHSTCILFFFSFFFFLCKQDSYGAKVAFVSSYLENPLSRTSYFSRMFNSKHKICCLSLSWMTKQFFNIGITISTRLTRSMKKDFSRKYQL